MIALIAGTRPEVIKLAPVYKALRRSGAEWVWTDQQHDLGDETFGSFELSPEHRLFCSREEGTLSELQTILSEEIGATLASLTPEMVVVQGDTLTAAVAAIQAFLAGIPVAHVEAGLRSWDVRSPYPEEACRVWIDAVADVKFAPTQQAAATLSGEVYVTGNTVVDAVKMIRAKRVRPGRYAVVTMHRRENAGRVEEVCDAVERLLAGKVFDRVVWPVHPNPSFQGPIVKRMRQVSGCELVKPLPYDQMVNLMRYAQMLITDSGGLQEEALTLSVPCLVMRESTERPEGVQTGGSRLVGTDPDKIVGWSTYLMEHPDEYAEMKQARNPYGDGKAGRRIAGVLRARRRGRLVDVNAATWSGVG